MNIKCGVIAALSIFVSHIAVATESESYRFVGLGIFNNDGLVAPKHADFSSDFASEIETGMGWRYRLDESWVLESELSVSYATSNIADNDYAYGGRLDNIGLWSTLRVKNQNWFENVSPFAEVSVGAVDVRYDQNQQRQSEWVGGYKASLGLEFDVFENGSVAIAVGTSDHGDIN